MYYVPRVFTIWSQRSQKISRGIDSTHMRFSKINSKYYTEIEFGHWDLVLARKSGKSDKF